MSNITKQFDSTPITFNDGGWFNATEAAKAFEKETAQWLRLPSTVEYMTALAEAIPVKITGLVATKRGQNGGTWLHPKLGVAFARWPDVRFAVWCDAQIDAIMRGAQTIKAERSALRVEFAPMTDAIVRARQEGSGIYAIKCASNSRLYIGSAVSFRRRVAVHLCMLRAGKHHSKKLQRAWDKYGSDKFMFGVIEVVPEKSGLIAREQHWIDALDACGSGMNSNPVAGSVLGRKHSAETRAKLSASHKGKPGRPHTDESKALLSAAHAGKKLTQEHRKKLSEAKAGQLKVITDDVVRRVLDARASGMSYVRAAKHCGVSESTAFRAVKLIDLFRRRHHDALIAELHILGA